MTFHDGHIQDVLVRDLRKYSDSRGWLIETFRSDEIHSDLLPAMAYVSSTLPGVARGPHEHADQTDVFAFIGPSIFRIYLWDARKNSSTYRHRLRFEAGEGNPKLVVIPPGVVHAYKNIGAVDGLVLNFPNRLYAGKGKKDTVDEIRHENSVNSIYLLD
ncbi:MAG: dTDP-4-dehydrorhamnose 3,5-epimerase family protein [Ignavibacteriales bacterium]|nr:dTDP-4-dehydrorhamnose 3,5-epimerase family protein [Ignavibacteriales bacterium]